MCLDVRVPLHTRDAFPGGPRSHLQGAKGRLVCLDVSGHTAAGAFPGRPAHLSNSGSESKVPNACGSLGTSKTSAS